jgi:hypothetical protein
MFRKKSRWPSRAILLGNLPPLAQPCEEHQGHGRRFPVHQPIRPHAAEL